MTLTRNEVVADAGEHPATIIQSEMTHAELLGLTETVSTPADEFGNKNEKNAYRERQINACDLDFINRHLTAAREAHCGKYKTPVTAETLHLGVDGKYHPEIRAMLKKHEKMWSGELGEINITKHTVDLIPGVRPVKSAPYRAGPNERQ